METRTFLFDEFWEQIPRCQRNFEYCGFDPIFHRQGFISAYLEFDYKGQKHIVEKYAETRTYIEWCINHLNNGDWETEYEEEIAECGKLEARQSFVDNWSDVVADAMRTLQEDTSLSNEKMRIFSVFSRPDITAACDMWAEKEYSAAYKLPKLMYYHMGMNLIASPAISAKDYIRCIDNYSIVTAVFTVCNWLTFYHDILDWNRLHRSDEEFKFHEVKALTKERLLLQEPFIENITTSIG